MVGQQPPVVVPSGSISAFQPRSRSSRGSPHQGLSKGIYVQHGTSAMGSHWLAELCQVSRVG